jgi:hypothetical protein
MKTSKIRLKPIDLDKSCVRKGGCGGRTDHPDIDLRKQYLIKYDGRFYAGDFSMQWYGLNFNGVYDAGLQYDAPGTNSSSWEAIWEIIEVK